MMEEWNTGEKLRDIALSQLDHLTYQNDTVPLNPLFQYSIIPTPQRTCYRKSQCFEPGPKDQVFINEIKN